nr:cation-dependent mannose-6-phosphate receptor [Biomphalaria glabrata]
MLPLKVLTVFYVLMNCAVVVASKLQDSTCTQLDSCSCTFGNGTLLDLSPLAFKSRPRFVLDGIQFQYLYNPCYNFTFGECENVSMCQYQNVAGNYFVLGTQDSAYFVTDTDDDHIVFLLYSHTDSYGFTRHTTVQLVCSNQTTDDFIFLGEHTLRTYVFMLVSPHCCAK